jgi:hypothetical protein
MSKGRYCLMHDRVIYLKAAAPPKPAVGAPCNGCGVCCAVVLCPVGMAIFRRRQGPCPALAWDNADAVYHCGLLVAPRQYLRWMPSWLASPWRRWMARAISAGKGCDAYVTAEALPDEAG